CVAGPAAITVVWPCRRGLRPLALCGAPPPSSAHLSGLPSASRLPAPLSSRIGAPVPLLWLHLLRRRLILFFPRGSTHAPSPETGSARHAAVAARTCFFIR